MAYYGGFQLGAFQRNAFQLKGSGYGPVNPGDSGGDYYILRRRRRRQ